MPSSDVSVTTPDGECPCSLHAPDGTGPWPAVIMYPDAGGPRASFREMADWLAGLGYVVLVPDVYYRSGHYEPFKMADVFTDPAERQRLGMLMSSLSTDGTVSDATAFADFLAAHPSVIAGPIGTTGYSVMRVQLAKNADGNHDLSGDKAFGVTVYGYGQYTSYWYPGGLDLDLIPG